MYSPNHYLYYGDVDHVPEGRGLLKLYPQNIEIEGQMRLGKPDGECRIRDLAGVFSFEGLIRDQAPNSGRFVVNNATEPEKSYEIVLDDYPNNPAKILFKDGSRY